MSRLLIDPLVSFDLIEREELNRCLVAWDHKMGPLNRPRYKEPIDFGICHQGELVAVVAADTLIKPTCELDRTTAFELSRLCAATPHLCRAAIRIWREFAYPEIVRAWGTPWAVSYQDAGQHLGRLYRFDGWLRIGCSTGGRDQRAAAETASTSRRVLWAWNDDEAERWSITEAMKSQKWPDWAEAA